MDKHKYHDCPCCGSANIKYKLTAIDHTLSGEKFEIWECDACTVRFTQNAPVQSAIGRYYQSENYISHTDTKKGLINSLYHIIRKQTLRQKQQLVEKITGVKQGSLLDIGAGTGAFAAYVKAAGWQVTALEPDELTRQRATELYGISLQNNEQLFSLPPASFDAITLWHVLEHVHALHEYIDQILKVLKPGGKAFIAVPNYTSYDAETYQENWAAYDVPRHLYHFSPLAMKKLMAKHGMKVEKLLPMWYDSFYVSMLSEQYKNGKPANVSAFKSGLLSNLKAGEDYSRCSSVIYVVGLA